METHCKPGSRLFFCLHDLVQRGSRLHRAGSILFSVYLSLLPALTGSCQKLAAGDPGGEADPADPEPVVDSVLTRVSFLAESAAERLDLFIYGAEGIRALERHLRLDSLPPDGLRLPTTAGEKILVGIANSPYGFNLNALARYDAMEQLRFQFADDDPEHPILGGMAATRDNAGTVRLQPLLCRIVLRSVANTMDGYELLEEPRVRLCDLPDAAEILREKDFRPAELIDTGEWIPLPHDIGYFPLPADIVLWCYPNDTPENILGVSRPTLEFECRIQGELCSFEVPLPPLSRGCTKEVELTVDGPGSFYYKIR